MTHQYIALEDTVYFGFVTNDTGGSAVDGTTPLYDVRLGGGTAGAAAIDSGTPTLLTSANYGPGCYEVEIDATAANGFAAGNTYLVYVTATADAETPGSCVGSFRTDHVPADVREWLGTAVTSGTGGPDVNVNALSDSVQSATDLQDFADAGYNPATNLITGITGTKNTLDDLNDIAATAIVSGGAINTTGGAVDDVTATADVTNLSNLPTIPTNWITANGIATDAIGAAELAAGAVTEIQTGLATPTNITAGTITTVTNLTNAPTSGDLTATMKTSVNTEVDTALNVTTYAEPVKGAPTATTTLVDKIGYLYKFLRNRSTSDATTISVYNDDAVTVDHDATHSDNGTTYDRGEFTDGP